MRLGNGLIFTETEFVGTQVWLLGIFSFLQNAVCGIIGKVISANNRLKEIGIMQLITLISLPFLVGFMWAHYSASNVDIIPYKNAP